MTTSQPVVLLSAGGTGGHVFPARALAEILLAEGYRVELATDTRGLKYFQGLDAVKTHVIDSGGYLPGIAGKIRAVIGLAKGYIQSRHLLKSLRPVCVVGFGGYPSAPPIFAAQTMGIPTILHEQNAILGLANKWLAKGASRIALSFEHTEQCGHLAQGKITFVGNPVRGDIARLGQSPFPPLDAGGKLHLMIVGGSQGARVFGTTVPDSIASLPPDMRTRLTIAHQARPEDIEKVRSIYADAGMTDVDLRSFFDDMPAQMAQAHVLISRSGASTVAELAAAGRPALFIPFPWNRDLQQVFNAQCMVEVGGGWMILEQELTILAIQNHIRSWLEKPETLALAAASALKLGQPEAARNLAKIVAEFR